MAYEIEVAIIGAGASFSIAIAGFCYSYTEKKRGEAKAERGLFEAFNERFNAMNEELNRIIEGKEIINTNKSNADIVQDYLNLCSEEYLWYKRDLIGKEIWVSWLAGINYCLKCPIIEEHFIKEKQAARASYYGLFDVLKIDI